MRNIILTIGFMFITLGCFSQDNPGVLDRVYVQIIFVEKK